MQSSHLTFTQIPSFPDTSIEPARQLPASSDCAARIGNLTQEPFQQIASQTPHMQKRKQARPHRALRNQLPAVTALLIPAGSNASAFSVLAKMQISHIINTTANDAPFNLSSVSSDQENGQSPHSPEEESTIEYGASENTGAKGSVWLQEEINLLLRETCKYLGKNKPKIIWDKISTQLGGIRSPEACRKRFYQLPKSIRLARNPVPSAAGSDVSVPMP